MPAPQPVDVLIDGGMIVTVDPAWTIIPDGAIAIQGGRIVALGPRDEVRAAYTAARIVNGHDKLIIPGLINTHTHAPMVLYRGLADDLPLMTWLQKHVWPTEARFTTADSVAAGALLAAAEMISSGTTCFADMYFFVEQTARVMKAAGLRGVIGQGIIDFPTPDAPDPETALADCAAFVARWHGDPLIIPGPTPHSVYATSAQWITAAHAITTRYDVPFQIHVSETAIEVENCRAAHDGLTPPAYLEALGVLDGRTVAAHGVHLTDEDMALFAARGVGVAHCAESNMKLASGAAPVAAMIAAGIDVGLGSDGAMSNNDLSMLGAMNMSALLPKVIHMDPTMLPAPTVVYLATQGGANVLGVGDRIGSLEVGKRADLVLLRLDRPHAIPLYDPYSHLAYVLDDADVDTVLVEGRVLYEGGQLLTVDLAAARQEVEGVARRVRLARMGNGVG